MKGDLVVRAVAEAVGIIALYVPLVVVTNSSATSATEVGQMADVRIVQAAAVTTRGTAVPMKNDSLQGVVVGTDRSAVSDRVAVLLADSSAKQTLFSAYVEEVIALMTGIVGVSVLLVSRIVRFVKAWTLDPGGAGRQASVAPATEAKALN